MVFTTAVNFIRSRGPDEFWRKRRIFKLASHFQGRKRNCYSIAIRYVHRALVYATKGRKLKKLDMANLWEQRVVAGCEQHGIPYSTFRETMARSGIMLNRSSLANLACWEPHSFKALTDIARDRALQDGLSVDVQLSPPRGVVTRGMIK